MRQINRPEAVAPARPGAGRTLAGLLAAGAFCAGLTGCAGLAPDLPANRYPVPEQAPNSNLIPEYGGKLKSEAEKKQEIKELEEARKAHTKEAEGAIGSRRY